MVKRFLVCAFIALIPAAYAQSPDTLENNVYRDKTGVQFTLPPDWVLVSHACASQGAHTVLVRDTITNVIATVWLKPRTVDQG
ncbi:MAG: hypothetical protein ABSC93_28170 [Bryobacteraceae bacterium]|jgi:hypothetical protein